jgi:hypothetical protein
VILLPQLPYPGITGVHHHNQLKGIFTSGYFAWCQIMVMKKTEHEVNNNASGCFT